MEDVKDLKETRRILAIAKTNTSGSLRKKIVTKTNSSTSLGFDKNFGSGKKESKDVNVT